MPSPSIRLACPLTAWSAAAFAGDCMRAFASFVIVALFAACLTIAGATPSSAPRLRLNRSILAATPQSPAVARALAAAGGPYTIIQLRGPITLADRAALEQTGLSLLE